MYAVQVSYITCGLTTQRSHNYYLDLSMRVLTIKKFTKVGLEPVTLNPQMRLNYQSKIFKLTAQREYSVYSYYQSRLGCGLHEILSKSPLHSGIQALLWSPESFKKHRNTSMHVSKIAALDQVKRDVDRQTDIRMTTACYMD